MMPDGNEDNLSILAPDEYYTNFSCDRKGEKTNQPSLERMEAKGGMEWIVQETFFGGGGSILIGY